MSLVDKLAEQFSPLAWLLTIAILIQNLTPLANTLKWLYRRARPQPKMEDGELKKMISELIEDLSRYMLERKNRDPVYRSSHLRITDDEEEMRRRQHELAQEITRHSNETMSEYTSRFIQRIAQIREELAQRGIEDAELDSSFKHQVNKFSINIIIAKLAETSVKI